MLDMYARFFLTSPVHITPEEFESGGFALKTHQMVSVHTTQEEFESGGFALKTHQMVSVHTTPEEFKNAPTMGHFGFVFQGNSIMFEKLRFHHVYLFFYIVIFLFCHTTNIMKTVKEKI